MKVNKRIFNLLILFLLSFRYLFSQEIYQISLTHEEKKYIETKKSITMAVDPDWYPYEKINEAGLHYGIAADMLKLISLRTGLKFELIRTKDWEESLALAKEKKVDMLSFLNQTPERSKWLSFSNPFYVEPNVLITREEHSYIKDLSKLKNESIVLPRGTSIEERFKQKYSNIKVLLVDSEVEALNYVNDKKADMTIRSMTMAGYIIKNKGYFNLKIAGEIVGFDNKLRIGLTKKDIILQNILNKAILTITDEEVDNIVNKHVSLKIVKGFDYRLFFIVLTFSLLLSMSILFWGQKIKKINRNLKIQQKKLFDTTKKLEESELLHRSIINASPDAIILSDYLGNIITSSPSTDIIMEKSKNDVIIGKNISDFISLEDKSKLKENVNKLINGEKIGKTYYNGFTFSSRNVIFEVNSEVIYKSNNEECTFVSIIRDVTEKKKIENALLNSEARYKELTAQLEEKNLILEEIATIDSLSGLKNRYFFNNRLEEESERTNRYKTELSLILIDIDHFKRINDTYGHDTGDDVIKKISKMLQESTRKYDIVSRWGGEEFAILLPNTSLEESVLVAEKIRKNVESIIYSFKEVVTISAGVTIWTEFDTPKVWFKRADEALYDAKTNGRNRICTNIQTKEELLALLNWDESYSSGYNLVDNQHKEILTLSQIILKDILENLNPETIIKDFEKLILFVGRHFADEEAILKKYKFSFLEEHIIQHNLLICKSKDLLNKFNNGNLSSKSVIKYLIDDVVLGHLENEDSKFFSLFK